MVMIIILLCAVVYLAVATIRLDIQASRKAAGLYDEIDDLTGRLNKTEILLAETRNMIRFWWAINIEDDEVTWEVGRGHNSLARGTAEDYTSAYRQINEALAAWRPTVTPDLRGATL